MATSNPSTTIVNDVGLISRFANWPIRVKIAALFSLGLVIIAAAVGAPIFFTANTLLASEAVTALNRQNESVSNEIDLLSAKAASDLLLARQNDAFDRLYSTGDPSALEAVQDQILYLQDRFSIDEICLITANGMEMARCTQGILAGVDELSPDETSNPFFSPTLALADGEVYRSPAPYISPDTHRWVVAHATPIVLSDGTKAGIFHFEIPLAWFAAKVDTNGLAGGYSFLMTKDGQMLVHPNIDEMRRATGIDPSNPDQAAFPPATAWASDDFHRLIERMKSEQAGSGTYRDGSETYEVIYRPAFNNFWIVATVLARSAINRPASNLLSRTLIIIIPLLLLVVGIMLWYTARLVIPITRLTNVAQQAIAGDLSGQVLVESTDEVGILATAFNTMTTQLQQTLEGLSQHVADLNISRNQSEERARNLLAISEISRIISTEQKLDVLLALIARLMSDRFGFYHTGIFLIDETNQFAVLLAANSEGGKKMLERGHRLEVGSGGMVGFVARFGTSRIALDVGMDAVFFNNPDLPNTRSEMALPLKSRDQTVGVLDVQSESPGAFTENDANTLSILADQIAIAIDNTRLLQQTQQALKEFQSLYQQNIRGGWARFSRDESSVGYHQTISGGTKIHKPVDAVEIRDAINQGQTLVGQPQDGREDSFIVVPLKLRGQIIGTLRVQAPAKNRRWTSDEIGLAGAISERLALALENARLIQEAQKLLIKEQTINEVTSKIGASIDIDNVLQTAVEELGRAMPGSEVSIRFDRNGK